MILGHGAEVNVIETCRGGLTPLLWAAAEGHDRVVEVLIRFYILVPILVYKYWKGSTNLVTYYLKYFFINIKSNHRSFGADINYETDGGDSAVTLAYKYGHTNVLSRLANTNSNLSSNQLLRFLPPSFPANPTRVHKSVLHYESEIVQPTTPEEMVHIRDKN